MKRFIVRRLVTTLCASGLIGLSAHVFASGFQLFEQDITSIANYHAGYAALADNASIGFYNPAGLTRFKNQQIVFGGVMVTTDILYKGSVSVSNPPIEPTVFNNVTVQGGNISVFPVLHYATPINEDVVFGFSVEVPFGLETDYGRSTPVKYAATLTSIKVIDFSPSLGLKLTDKASIGVGFDIVKTWAEFDNVGTFTLSDGSDTDSTNKANGTGYGGHLGLMYEFTPDTRAGVSYHTQVAQHLSGSSKFDGPLAEDLEVPDSNNAHTNIRLPPYTAFSLYHRINPCFAVMGTALYTQWSFIKMITLQNISGIDKFPPEPSETIEVDLPQYYRNTWNFTVGADYYATDKLTLRGGIGYDQTPVRNQYRTLQLPDNNRYVFALGGHYQASKVIGVDAGWTHVFIRKVNVNPPPQVTGAETTTTDGKVRGGADVLGVQFVWDIA